MLSLNGKVAVIYADGNSFGKIQRNIIKSKMGNAEQIQAQRDFDVALKAKRDAYLQSLVQFLHIQGAIQFDEGGSFIPLETLLWGGDEMTIVVPAWLGFRVLDHFISGYGTFDIDENTLTHSIGMVFCSHKTPIQKAQTAAISLADNIKSLENGRSRTYFDYMVLESIDYPTQALSEFWQAQYGEIAKYRTPLALTDTFRLGGNGDPNICPNLKNQLDALPRASMYHLVEQAIATQAAEIEAQGSSSQQEKANRKGTTAQLGDVLNKVLHSNGEDHHESIKHLLALFTPLSIKVKDKEEDEQPTIETPREYQNTDTLFWIHLLELYDYLAPEPPKTTHYQAGGTYERLQCDFHTHACCPFYH
ncbi:hypothetical protein JCM19237_1867 [Photobacterium aphoticum]|uniref:Uncharacterized protein n=1 Tax=Photobacterium aphoticum TaxID=754436 RepID=A0A090RF82_9GAMM|nr:hypothetical protein JCM19237_1867 [Photobacterium aphoticum]